MSKPEQWVVLINGFESEEEATTFIDAVFAEYPLPLAALVYPTP